MTAGQKKRLRRGGRGTGSKDCGTSGFGVRVRGSRGRLWLYFRCQGCGNRAGFAPVPCVS